MQCPECGTEMERKVEYIGPDKLPSRDPIDCVVYFQCPKCLNEIETGRQP